MLYILTSLKPEAQAFVDRYKLKKDTLSKYKIFKNEKMMVMVSGLGVYNVMMATQTFINHFDMEDEDIFLNIGICGASTKYDVGELIEVSTVDYQDNSFELNARGKKSITCVDEAMSEALYEIVDMESFGFYDATIHSTAIKNRYMFKVVSDHFEPSRVTKEQTKKLIFDVLDRVEEIVF